MSKTVSFFLVLLLVVFSESSWYEDNIHFKLYTKTHRYTPEQLIITKRSNNILQTSFNVLNPTKVIVHGYKSSSELYALVRIKNNYLSKYDYNVIIVDWSHFANGEYVTAIGYSRKVAVYVARLFLVMMKLGVQDIHAIGFSLGAHIPAVAANYLGSHKIKRITGLDPAKPFLMSVGVDAKLDASDAEFVDVYHTESFLQGKKEACGHVDIEMNWGEIQPGCAELDIGCAHERAPVYFAESIVSEKGFWGFRPELYRKLWSGEISKDQVMNLVGDKIDTSLRGWYNVFTNSESPFALGREYK